MREAERAAPPFAHRRAVAIWRGATTGYACGATNPRWRLTSRWARSSSPRVSVGYDPRHVVQCFRGRRDVANLTKGRLSLPEMLGHKYVVAAEGNDVATGLPWMLYTESVPLMPRPTIETWLLHGDLAAWREYVPLSDDFADLEEQVLWLEAHAERALEIARAGRAFLERTLGDRVREAVVAGEVVRRTVERLHGA